MHYLDRYTEMLRAKKKDFAVVNGVLFVRKERWIMPLGPVVNPCKLDHAECRKLLHQLGGLWIMWNDGFGASVSGTDWYAVICRQHKPVEEVSSVNTRSKIRRGLKNCTVRMVSVQEIANNGYDTYCAALVGYGNGSTKLLTPGEFYSRVMTDEQFDDILQQWAVYIEGKMVGFAQNLVYDKVEVDYTLIKMHPEYLNRYSSYALFYQMNEYYLCQASFQYVNDGFRSISHETGIQEFLIKEFGFEKAYTDLHVHYSFPFGQLLKITRPFQALATYYFPKVDALFAMDRLRLKS